MALLLGVAVTEEEAVAVILLLDVSVTLLLGVAVTEEDGVAVRLLLPVPVSEGDAVPVCDDEGVAVWLLLEVLVLVRLELDVDVTLELGVTDEVGEMICAQILMSSIARADCTLLSPRLRMRNSMS